MSENIEIAQRHKSAAYKTLGGPAIVFLSGSCDTGELERRVAQAIAKAEREGVLVGVRAGIEAARELFVFRGLPQDGPPYIYEHEAREMVEALDAQAIAERACKGGSGE